MKHIIFFYFIFTFAVGFLSIAITVFLYLRFRIKLIKYYLYFILFLTYSFIIHIFTFYKHYYVVSNYLSLELVILYLKILGQGFGLFIIPLFSFNLIGAKFKKNKKLVFGFFSFSTFLFFLAFFFYQSDLHQKIELMLLFSKVIIGLRIIIILYCILKFFNRVKKIKEYEIKLFVKAIIITTLIIIPIMSLDFFIPQFRFFINNVEVSPNHLGIFYLVWNLVSLSFVLWYFVYKFNKMDMDKKLAILIKNYNITEREKEIICQIADGLSNKEICEKLFISMPTVKTHIQNIYQKTNATNRVELVNLIKK